MHIQYRWIPAVLKMHFEDRWKNNQSEAVNRPWPMIEPEDSAVALAQTHSFMNFGNEDRPAERPETPSIERSIGLHSPASDWFPAISSGPSLWSSIFYFTKTDR